MKKGTRMHYTYYSYEEFGRGYIGKRSCKCKPEEDVKYFGSYRDKTFKPTQKIILETYDTEKESRIAEGILHKFYDVKRNPHFANQHNANENFCVAETQEQRSEIAKRGHASLTPEQRSERSRKARMSMTPEQRSESSRKARMSLTPEKRSELARIASASLTPEQRSEASRKGHAKRTTEQRRESGRKAQAGRTPEQRSESVRRGHATLTPEQRKERTRKAHAKLTPEQRSERSRKAYASLTTEQQSERSKKAANQKFQCTETGYITNAGALTCYQRAKGIDTSKRIKLS